MTTYKDGDQVFSKCPACGVAANRRVYDIGDGPELCCDRCDWCWGANGQDLSPIPPTTRDLWEELR